MGDRLETRDRRETETGGRRRQVGDGDRWETETVKRQVGEWR